MADWHGAARSNYVKFKDVAAVIALLAPFPILIQPGEGAHAGKHCLLSSSEYGGWDLTVLDDEDNEVELDVVQDICPLLAEGEVLVLMESGAEKLRYVTGYAVAYTWDGRRTALNILDIYKKAADEFGVPLGSITDASS